MTGLQVGEEPSLGEFEGIGVPGWLISIANEHGMDVALAVWQRLAEEAIRTEDRGRIYIPAFTRLLRAERNRYIRTLGQEGCSPETIKVRLQRELRIDIALCTIQRVLRASVVAIR